MFLTDDENIEAQEAIDNYGFNLVASQKISLDREISDTRHDE